jgi:hypothetical protein
MVLDRSAARNRFEAGFFDIIEKHGWHVMSVANAADEEGPIFSYSTGIFQRLRAPEMLIVGLNAALSASMINHYAAQVAQGASIEAGAFYGGYLEGFDVCFIEAWADARRDFATWADWYYERKPFPILQCVWPTKSGIWPWDGAAEPWFKDMQPLLGPPPIRN